jgi:hypothetical protein
MSDEKSSTPTIVEKVKSNFLQTFGMLKARGERVELKPGRPGPFLTQEDLGRGLSARDKATRLILGYGTDKELIGLAEKIKERRDKLPKKTYWICKNPKCGWRHDFSGPDSHEGPCLMCNSQRFKDGGFMREMSKGEIEELEKDRAADKVRILAQMKKERELLKQDFNLRAARGEFDR